MASTASKASKSKKYQDEEETRPLVDVAGPSNAAQSDSPPPSYDEPYADTVGPVPSAIASSDEPPPFTEYFPEQNVSSTSERIKTHDPHLNTDGEALYQYLVRQNRVHPYFYAQITGTHSVTRTRWVTRDGRQQRETITETVTDFDFDIDLTEIIYDKYFGQLMIRPPYEKCYRGTVFKKKGDKVISENDQNQAVRDWCHRYCEDRSYFKEFKVKKEVQGHDCKILRKYFETAVRATNYVGTIKIKFKHTRDGITVQPDNMLSRWRTNKWVRIGFYCSLLFFISWPILFFATKRYHNIVSNWYSVTLDGRANFTHEQIGETWFDVIRWACLNGRKNCEPITPHERDMVIRRGLAEGRRRRGVDLRSALRNLGSGNPLGMALGLADAARQLTDDSPAWGQDESL